MNTDRQAHLSTPKPPVSCIIHHAKNAEDTVHRRPLRLYSCQCLTSNQSIVISLPASDERYTPSRIFCTARPASPGAVNGVSFRQASTKFCSLILNSDGKSLCRGRKPGAMLTIVPA